MARLPGAIWAIGGVSLLMDISSEMIHGLMPVFLLTVLGASPAVIGLIEGIGEAVAAVTKLGSGMVSDRMGRRKPLTVLGYGLSTLSKPVFAMAGAPGMVLGARVADRLGKGIRGAPRDALVADLAPPGMAGAAFGLRQSLDSIGAFVGPALAMALMWLFAGDFRAVFWVAAVPGAMAVLLLIVAVHEPDRHIPRPPRAELRRGAFARMPGRFWLVLGIGSLLTLARFSDAFLILLATERGLDPWLSPMVLVAIYAAASVAAWPVGALSDRIGRRGLLIAGAATLMAADLLLMRAGTFGAVFGGAVLWGLHLGLTQGLMAALVAGTAPGELRGTGFGVYQLATGLALLLASAVAGAIWAGQGPEMVFAASAVLAAAAAAALALWRI